MDTLTELGDVQIILSGEQKRDFAVDSTLLSVVLGASVFATLIASFFILLVQLALEGERIAREARASKIRRLRSKREAAEVLVPSITQGLPKHFHVFLSHATKQWGSNPGLAARSELVQLSSPRMDRCGGVRRCPERS